MNWIKQNKKLAAILGVMIAGGLGLGTWLYLSWSDFTTQTDQWTELDKKTSNLENSKFTPNADNVAQLKQKLEDYRDKFNTLQKVLLSPALQQPIKPISETDFQAKVKERTRLAMQKAGKITDLPKDFALGFEEYTGTLPPNPEVAAELNVQLDVTEKLITTLLEAGVKSIDQIERTRLPTERGGVGRAGAPTPPPPPAPPKNSKSGAPAPVVSNVTVVDRYPIKVTFTCDQGPLQSIMNNLANPASTPQFLAVRQLHVENEKPDAPTKDEVKQLIKPPGSTPTGPAGPPPDRHTVPVVKPFPVDAANIMGGENLKVYLEVDYIRFRQPAEDAKAATPKR